MKINSILAGVALTAGLFAAFTNHSASNNLYPEWKFSTEKKEGIQIRYISASHLANQIYLKEEGFSILDARTQDEYDEYHIPGAIKFSEVELKKSLVSSEKIVICAEPGFYIPHEKLKNEGDIYYLKGGLEDWYGLVLFPNFARLKVRNSQLLEKIIQRSSYFGGKAVNTESLNITLKTSRFREGC